MTERPILFSGPMINAMLAGKKTVTRRLIKPQPTHSQIHSHGGKVIYDGDSRMWCWKDLVLDNIWDFPGNDDRKALAARCPKGIVGDRLWVRETSAVYAAAHSECGIVYRADHATGDLTKGDGGYNFHQFSDDPEQAAKDRKWAEKHSGNEQWIPSIFMPRFASRITLEITGVRVERLQEITEAEAVAEGVNMPDGGKEPPEWWSYVKEFEFLWDRINGDEEWKLCKSNPFVFVIEFKRA